LALATWIAAATGCQTGGSGAIRSWQEAAAPTAGGGLQPTVVRPVLGIPVELPVGTAPTTIPALAETRVANQAPNERVEQSVLLPAGTLDLDAGWTREQVISLSDALRLAGVESPTIGLAEEIVRASLAEQTLARSLLFPSLHAGATLSAHQGTLLSAQGIVRTVDRESLFFGAGADVRGAGTVAVPGVILTGHLGDAVFAPRVARQKVLSSGLDAQATRNQVLLQVANAYLALAGAEARVLALRESERELAEVARLTADFAAAGQGRDGDAQRARGELQLLQGTRLQAEEDAALSAAELSRLLSVDPATRLRPEAGTPPLVHLVDARQSLEHLIEQALAQHPEIAARGADVALRETRLRQERVRPLLPTLAVGFSAGDFGGGSDQVGYRFSHFNGRTDFDVLAVWTLQNLGFGNRAIQNKVRAEIGQADAARAQAIDKVRREVAEAFADSAARREQMDLAQQRAATAQKAFQQDLNRTKNLEGRLLEVLDSFNQLTAARQELIATMVGFSQAQFNLYVALGKMPAL
jgi:outer membrane protein TolC